MDDTVALGERDTESLWGDLEKFLEDDTRGHDLGRPHDPGPIQRAAPGMSRT
jgi:hypothetical protein